MDGYRVFGRTWRGIPRVLFAALLVASVIIGGFFTDRPVLASGFNEQVNFQGRLFNSSGAPVADGRYNIQFRLYQGGTGTVAGNPGGTLLWTESHLNSAGNGITIRNGYLSVQLGSVTPLAGIDWNTDTMWISVNIGNTNLTCTSFANCVPDGEMLPMKRLSSTPYAINSGRLGGKTAAEFLQLAAGVQEDVSQNTSSIFLNKTGAGGNFMQLQSNGLDQLAITNTGDLLFGNTSDHSVKIADSPSGAAGQSLTVAGGNAGAGGIAAAGGNLILQGGNAAGIGNASGGDVTIAGGSGVGSGASGLVNLGASRYSTGTFPTCSSDCTIDRSLIDNHGTVIISASDSNVKITIPAPTRPEAGRILYITTTSASTDFKLESNSDTTPLSFTMKANTTATMIWNGNAWTPGGASNAITLQATYDNASNPEATPEIKLDHVRGTIDIQDADQSIGRDLLNIRGSNPDGLGTVLFGVSNTGRVTIQGTTDNESAFRVLNPNGDYLFNINSSNNYVISNGIRAPGNEIINPSFEAGGNLDGGEEGWLGSSQGSMLRDPSHARTGSWSLSVLPNANNLDIYAGSFYEVRPGDRLHFSGHVKSAAGSNGQAGIQITWFDRDRNVISYATDYNSLPGTSYVQRNVNAAAPANAAYARVSATVRASANAGRFYFDDFYLKLSSESAPMTFRNSVNSAAAFQIQSAGGSNTLLSANTNDNVIKIGDNTGLNADTTLLVLDHASADPSSVANKDGGLFYNSSSNSLKAVIGGTVVDICTTAVTCAGYSASASATIQLQSSSPGTAQTGHFNITGTGILTQLQTQDRNTASTNSQTLNIRSGNATGAGSNSGNIIIDTGSASGNRGSITLGTGNVAVNMGGNLNIQGSNSLSLGTSSAASGSILFRSSAGANTVTLRAPSANPTNSYTITLPQNLGIAGDCLKDTGGGTLGFSECSPGSTVTLQNAYDNSNPATMVLADNKSLTFVAQNTATTAPSILFDLQCGINCTGNGNGRFAIQNNGVDVFRVSANNAGITLGTHTQIGSSTPDSSLVMLRLDSYNGADEPVSAPCSTSVNQGALYYNTSMGSIRGCIGGMWVDVSNPDTLGLLTYGIVPSSGGVNNAYDLPSLINEGVSGPCKVSRQSATSVSIQSCVAYSNGRRFNVPATTLSTNNSTAPGIALGTSADTRWGHICLNPMTGAAQFTTLSGTSATGGMPTFSPTNPIVCLADVRGSTSSAGTIDAIYDVRSFTSTMKEAVNTSASVELGMLVDANPTNGAMQPATQGSGRLYGVVLATDGNTSGTGSPNAIVATVGSAWVKANAGTSGQFVRASGTGTNAGYANTIASIPNNSFYYSAGNTRTTYNITCSNASNCSGSLYVNFVVR